MAKVGFVCDGGLARGAYHMGVYKAYIDNGYQFDGFVGTSIGALNAVMLASGKYEIASKLWENITLDQIFETEISDFLTHTFPKINRKCFKSIKTVTRKMIKEKGVDTTLIRELIEANIDEKEVREVGTDFGLVTYSRSEKKAYEIFLDEIPNGKLTDYLMASSNFPGFKAQVIDDEKFIDGALYNNCPINMLLDKGYDEVIAVRTNAFARVKKYNKRANVTIIKTPTEIKKAFDFSPQNSLTDMRKGYNDALAMIMKKQEVHQSKKVKSESRFIFRTNS